MSTLCRHGAVVFGLLTVGLARAEEPVRLRERFEAGYQYRVRCRVDLSGTLTVPAEKGKPAPKPITMGGRSTIDYDERVLEVGADGKVRKTIRLCPRMDFDRIVGGRHQQTSLRPAVRRLVLLRHKNTEVPFSPDGPLTWGEIDLVRTDVFTPALVGLLPAGPVRVGERWTATAGAVQELTDLERIESGQLECRLDQLLLLEKRRHARVAFTGDVRGTNEDGPSRQRLEGYYYFDLESGHLSYLYLKGRHSMLEKDGREVGRIEGRFVLTRRPNVRIPELSDAALRGVGLEPNAANTQLLYDNPDLGLRFLYPRRWRVASVRGSQVALDGADGSGLLLTVEPPARVPTGAQFLAESRDWLGRQKARLLAVDRPRWVQESPPVEHFALTAEIKGQKVVMDYHVSHQRDGGVTVAARLLPRDLAAVQREVAGIARSVVVTRPLSKVGSR